MCSFLLLQGTCQVVADPDYMVKIYSCNFRQKASFTAGVMPF